MEQLAFYGMAINPKGMEYEILHKYLTPDPLVVTTLYMDNLAQFFQDDRAIQDCSYLHKLINSFGKSSWVVITRL